MEPYLQPHVTLLRIGPESVPYPVLSQMAVDLEAFESKPVCVTIRGLAWNARVACLLVSLPYEFPCATFHPHITIALVRGA